MSAILLKDRYCNHSVPYLRSPKRIESMTFETSSKVKYPRNESICKNWTKQTYTWVIAPLGGLETPAFRLTAERASQLRHRGLNRSLAHDSCVLWERNTFLSVWGKNFFSALVPKMSFHSVVVITSASHAEGPQFDPGWKQLIIFGKI